jgi:lysine biosynthesis protein LysW
MKAKKPAICPSCAIKIDISHNPSPYQRIICPDCGAFLEIVKIDHPVLDWFFGNEEFYDDMCFAVWNAR